VGLAAHTGVVDVRITAKAGTEAEADAMIAQVEAQVHERLGNVVFGADDDKLENVVLELLKRFNFNLVGIESGMDGLLARKLPNTASLPDLTPDSLTQTLRTARSESSADIALGVSVYMDERAAEMVMITPQGEKTHRITYGGPPKSLTRWSMNLALNWLRTTLEDMK